jgi:ubiquinone/menaquinone biosynthesis C-methylase UbiE
MKKTKIIRDYYEAELPRDPERLERLGWEDRESQFRRFQVLTDYVYLENKKILDVGCGMGHLLDHLKEREIPVSYTGLDLLGSMVKEASRRHGEHRFIKGDLFREPYFEDKSFDVIYCSGLFNLNTGSNFDFLLSAVEIFLRLTKETVVFNLLHHHSPERDDKYYYFYPDQVVRGVENLSPDIKSIQLVEHYLNNDFTLLLSLKDGPSCKPEN